MVKKIVLEQPGKKPKICKSMKEVRKQMDQSRNATVHPSGGGSKYLINNPGRKYK